MSCQPQASRFRLLDAFSGWAAAATDLVGLDDPRGVRLAAAATGVASEVPLSSVGARIPHPRLAKGCDRCTWFLATRAPPETRLMRLGPCDDRWRPIPLDACAPAAPIDVVAIAYDARRLALADRGADRLGVRTEDAAHVVGEAHVHEPRALAFSPRGDIVVASAGMPQLLVFDPSGAALGALGTALPPGEVDRLAFDSDCGLWVVIASGEGRGELWRAEPGGSGFERSNLTALAESFPPTGITAEAQEGFCIERGGGEDVPREVCFSWYGRPLDRGCLTLPDPVERQPRGQLLTGPLDSGIPRCRWHRVRVDADVPSGTRLEVAVSSSEVPDPPPQGVAVAPWQGHPAGVPHPDDWQVLPSGSLDATIDQPAGRYLFVRLRLAGDGRATPFVRRIHLDFPRNTSAELLPPVFREEPEAGDFTERFLALFDAALEEVSSSVDQFPALLDAQGAPDEVLPWIGQLLGLTFDPGWDADTQRRLLERAPELFRLRGTPAGMREAVRLVFEAEPAIEELGAGRAWGGVVAAGETHPAGARLGVTRLFGRGRERLTLGRSSLGASRIRSFGDPGNDPHASGAFRFVVSLPAGPGRSREQLARLVEGQKPAHTLAEVRLGGENGFGLTPGVQIGVDTVFGALPPLVLREQSRLGSRFVLAARGPASGMRAEGVVAG